MKTNQYPDLTYLADLANRAAVITLANFARGATSPMGRFWKEDETPLTVADTAINDLVIQSIGRDYPHIRVISEEGDVDVADAEYTVLCDPVDGTIPFSLGLPISTFCITVLKDMKPIVAMVADPFQKRIWCAARGHGAVMASSGLSVSKHPTIKRSNIGMIWWKGSDYHLNSVSDVLMEAGGHWINPASVAIFGGLIASGHFDASIFPSRKGWETAAMQLIVEEAGGKVTDIHGKEMRYGPKAEIEGHIISNGLIHDELVELVAKCQCVL